MIDLWLNNPRHRITRIGFNGWTWAICGQLEYRRQLGKLIDPVLLGFKRLLESLFFYQFGRVLTKLRGLRKPVCFAFTESTINGTQFVEQDRG